MTGIFMESNESLGLLFNRYKDIPDVIDKFIQKMISINNAQNSDNKTKTDVDDSDITYDLEKFKNTCKGMMKNPEPINPRKVNEEKSKIKKVRAKTEALVPKLAKLHEIVHGRQVNEGKQLSVMTSVVEWTKRVIIDTLNLCSQDLNLLSLVGTVYYRKLFEDGFDSLMRDDPYMEDLMEYAIDDSSDNVDIMNNIFNDFLESHVYESDEDSNDIEKKPPPKADINDVITPIGDDSKEEYYPIFPMSVSYNYGPLYTFMAPIIHKVTNGDEYTHTFMSFDPEFKTIMTFGGKGLEYMTVEDYEAFKYSKSVYVGVIWLTKDEMNDIKSVIKEYNDNPNEVRFSLINFFTMMIGKVKRKDKSHCCSTFLGYLLNVANKHNLTKDYSQTRPEDVTLLPRSFFVGTFKDLDDLIAKRPYFAKRIKEIYDANIDDIREYNNNIPRIMLTDNIKRHKSLKKFYQKIVQ